MRKKILLPILMLFVTTIVVAQTTRTVADGNWSNAAIWDNGVPNDATDAVILHAVDVDATSNVRDIDVVSPGGSLTNTGENLRVWGDINVSAPSLWIESGSAKTELYGTSSSITGKVTFNRLNIRKNRKGGPHIITVNDSLFINSYIYFFRGTVDASSSAVVLNGSSTVDGNVGYSPGGYMTGDLVWRKFVDRCNEWSTYAIPGPGSFSLADVASNTDVDGSGRRMIYTGFPDSDFPDFEFVNAYFYDESAGYQVPTSTTNVSETGKGYWYWNSDEVFNSSEPSIPQQWTWQVVLNGFQGAGDGVHEFEVFNTTDGFNLVGNPYPGVLDWDHSSWQLTDMDDALYYWNTCTQSYASYVNGVGSNGGDQYIPAGQGFWVEATGPNPYLRTQTHALTIGNVAVKPLQRGGAESSQDNVEEIPSLSIKLNGDETKLTFDANASLNYDIGFDAKKLLAPSFVKSDMSSIRTVYNGVNYSVNTIPFEETIIPLDVKGEGELTFEGAEQFDEVEIYLEDKLTGDVVDMKLSSSYTFTNDEYDFTDRFNIIISKKSSLAVAENEATSELSLYPNPFSDELNIQVSDKVIDRIDVYTTLGKLVLSETKNSNNVKINVADLQSGVYIVKIYHNNEEIGVVMTQKM